MTKIGLISDTHYFLDEAVFQHFKDVDEIWHIGDFGNIELANQLSKIKPLRGVYGNIDGYDIRSVYPEQLVFFVENVKILIRHIGGYPPKYNKATLEQIKIHRPQLVIAGHSHILKIMYDQKWECLYINPGAAGKQGWHKTRTIIRFAIDGDQIKDCEVIEL